jgi:RNA polymerase sigma-70 factor (ECF subfamily)
MVERAERATDTAADERELADGLRAGDSEAFERLVRSYGGRLLAVTRRILHDEEDARDAVQDAFISAYRARKQFQADARVSTWLHRIAVNAALMKLRSRRRKTETPIDDLLPAFKDDGQHYAESLVSWAEPADVALGRRETADFVREAIAELPDSYRLVLLMRDIEGRDTEETARELGITPNAVKIRLHRARMALRKLIAPRMEKRAS